MVLFSLDQAVHGRSAAMIANLVALDATAVFVRSHRLEVDGDGLAWFGHCDAVDQSALTGLIEAGPQAGLASLLDTVSPETAGRLAGLVNVLVIRRLDDPGLAARLAPLTSGALRHGEPGAVEAGGQAGYGTPAAPGALPGPGPHGVPAVFSAAQVATGPPPGPGSWPTGPAAGTAAPARASPAISAAALGRLRPDEFTLAVKGPVRRAVPAGRFIPGGLR